MSVLVFRCHRSYGLHEAFYFFVRSDAPFYAFRMYECGCTCFNGRVKRIQMEFKYESRCFDVLYIAGDDLLTH